MKSTLFQRLKRKNNKYYKAFLKIMKKAGKWEFD